MKSNLDKLREKYKGMVHLDMIEEGVEAILKDVEGETTLTTSDGEWILLDDVKQLLEVKK